MENSLPQKETKYNYTYKTLLTIVMILFTTLAVSGRNFYFSTLTGDDTRTSTQAQNASTPWKTISKLNSFFSSLLPGDSVLFKRGEVFYGSIVVTKSGTSSQPIIIGAYGTGNKPIISGFTTISGWTNLGNNIWESTNAVSTLSSLNMVVISNLNTPMGRTPNTGYYYFQSRNGTTQITSNNLTGTPNWTGAELAFNNNDWTVKRCPITAQSGGTLTFTNPETFTIVENNLKFIIQNDTRTLDHQNEWYFNPSTKKIRIYSVQLNLLMFRLQLLII